MIIKLIYNDFNKNIDIDISKTIGKIQEELLNLCSLIIYNIEYSELIVESNFHVPLLIKSNIDNNNIQDHVNNKCYILGSNDMLFNDIFEKAINKIGLNNNIEDIENIKIIIHDRKRNENGNVIKENKIIDKYNKWYQNQETENYINYLNNKSNISNRNIIRYPLDSLLTNILRINNGNIRHNLSHNLNIPTSEQSLNTSSENISESVINEESMIPENLLESEEKNDQIIPLDIDPCIESEENNETMESYAPTSLLIPANSPTSRLSRNPLNSSQILSGSDELSENIIENTLFEILNRNLNLDNIINDANWISENLLNENLENIRETRIFNRYFNTINNNENISSSLDRNSNISLSGILFSRLPQNVNNSHLNNDPSNDDPSNDDLSNDNISNNIPSNDNILNNIPSNNNTLNNIPSNDNILNNIPSNDDPSNDDPPIINSENDIYDDLPELEYILPQNLYNNNIYGNYSIPFYLNNTFNNSFLYSNISIFNTLMNEPILTQEDVIVALTEEQYDNLEHKILDLKSTSEENKIKECFICMESFVENEVITKIKCNHIFHKECIKPWLCKQSTKCPICRVEVDKGTPIFNNLSTNNNINENNEDLINDAINEEINDTINEESDENNQN